MTNVAVAFVMSKMAAKRDDDSVVRDRFKKLRRSLDVEGVMIGAHKRIAIPKSALTESDLTSRLGFKPVKIAIPEQGQTRFTSFRHVNNNYHIHDHGQHWTMHKDSHPSMTMAIQKALGRGAKAGKGATVSGLQKARRVAGAVTGGVSHVVTEGAPGLGYYVAGRLRGAGSTGQTVLNGQRSAFKRRLARWKARREDGDIKTAGTTSAQEVFGSAVKQIKARIPKLTPPIKVKDFRVSSTQMPPKLKQPEKMPVLKTNLSQMKTAFLMNIDKVKRVTEVH